MLYRTAGRRPLSLDPDYLLPLQLHRLLNVRLRASGLTSLVSPPLPGHGEAKRAEGSVSCSARYV